MNRVGNSPGLFFPCVYEIPDEVPAPVRIKFVVIEKEHFKRGLCRCEVKQDKTVPFDSVPDLKVVPEIPIIEIRLNDPGKE